MIDAKKEQWGDKIRVIAFGIDKDRAKLKEAINAKGLTAFEHYNVTKEKETWALQSSKLTFHERPTAIFELTGL